MKAQTRNADAALLDWLTTFASSIEHDDILRTWTVYTAEPGYRAGTGTTLRAAARDAMAAAGRADAARVITTPCS